MKIAFLTMLFRFIIGKTAFFNFIFTVRSFLLHCVGTLIIFRKKYTFFAILYLLVYASFLAMCAGNFTWRSAESS